MASQMIEFYQFRCHFVETQKRENQNRPLVLGNTPSFEIQRNDISTDNIQSFEMLF